MTSRLERYQQFFGKLMTLESTPVVFVYLLLIPGSLLWKKVVPPLDLRKVLVVYNFLCSALSFYSCALMAKSYVLGGPESFFKMEDDEIVQQGVFVYWITKNIELLDTVFMILRHKQRQISVLHVYHHSSILLLGDLCYHFYPWPSMAFMLGLNSFVHIFLYLYYGQAAMYQGQQPTWRKGLTQLQLLQFVIGIIHCTIGYLYYGFCVYGIFYGFSMLGLFGNFYYIAYVKSKKPAKKLE